MTIKKNLKSLKFCNIRNAKGYSLLHIAVLLGNEELTKSLLDAGADPLQVTEKKETFV